ncbi:MAG: hypothetical protein CL920_04030 [Deltaproteobacteria bacterium]|nr:hypothetical protein [Deltaproteobacteria bacterium]
MKEDLTKENKKKFLTEGFTLENRIDDPWRVAPDFPAYNGKIFKKLKKHLNDMELLRQQGPLPSSKGALILGEAGMGKTHLLMRLAQHVSEENHFLFIRRPNNEDAVARHFWTNILESLDKPIPGTEDQTTQLDMMIGHLMRQIIIRSLQHDIDTGKGSANKEKWLSRIQQAPDIRNLMGKGEQRSRLRSYFFNQANKYLREFHPDIELNLAAALIKYYLYTDQQYKRAMFIWLKGQPLPPSESEKYSLSKGWLEPPEEASERGVLQHKEEKALQGIRTIGVLSSYYHPLILACDQLEGLRNDEGMTHKWEDTLREIFTMTPNMLIVTCIFPSLWDEWFSQQLNQSIIDRIAEYKFHLEPLTPKIGIELLKAHMLPFFQKHNTQYPVYPFTPDDLKLLFERANTPRSFLKHAAHMLDEWCDDAFDEEEDEDELDGLDAFGEIDAFGGLEGFEDSTTEPPALDDDLPPPEAPEDPLPEVHTTQPPPPLVPPRPSTPNASTIKTTPPPNVRTQAPTRNVKQHPPQDDTIAIAGTSSTNKPKRPQTTPYIQAFPSDPHNTLPRPVTKHNTSAPTQPVSTTQGTQPTDTIKQPLPPSLIPTPTTPPAAYSPPPPPPQTNTPVRDDVSRTLSKPLPPQSQDVSTTLPGLPTFTLHPPKPTEAPSTSTAQPAKDSHTMPPVVRRPRSQPKREKPAPKQQNKQAKATITSHKEPQPEQKTQNILPPIPKPTPPKEIVVPTPKPTPPPPAPKPTKPIQARPASVLKKTPTSSTSTNQQDRETQIKRTIGRRFRSLHSRYVEAFDKGSPNEEDLYGRIRTITQFLIRQSHRDITLSRFDSAKVMPSHFRLRAAREEDDLLCIALSNHYKKSLTSRVKNIVQACTWGPPLIFLRDERCEKPTKTVRSRFEHVEEEERVYIELDAREHGRIYAFYEILVEIQQRDLTLQDESPISEAEYFAALRSMPMLLESRLFNRLIEAIESQPSNQPPSRPSRPPRQETPSAPSQPQHTQTPLPPPTGEHLNLPAAPSQFFDEARKVTKRLSQNHRPVLLEVESYTQHPTLPQRYTIQLGSSHFVDTAWEGQQLLQPKKPKDIQFATNDIELVDKHWGGYILRVLPQDNALEVLLTPPFHHPEEGLLYLLPPTTQRAYERWYSLQTPNIFHEQIAKHLLAAKGQATPGLQRPSPLPSTLAFQDIWPYSWAYMKAPTHTSTNQRVCEQLIQQLHDKTERLLILCPTNRQADALALNVFQLADTQTRALLHRAGRGADLQVFQSYNATSVLEHSAALLHHKIAEDAEQSDALWDAIDQTSDIQYLPSTLRCVITTYQEALSWLAHEDIFSYLDTEDTPFTSLFALNTSTIPRLHMGLLPFLARRRVYMVGDPADLTATSQPVKVVDKETYTWLTEHPLSHLYQREDEPIGTATLSSHVHNPLQTKRAHQDTTEVSFEGLPDAVWCILDRCTTLSAYLYANRTPNQQSFVRTFSYELFFKFMSQHTELHDQKGIYVSPYVGQLHEVHTQMKESGLSKWRCLLPEELAFQHCDILFFDTTHAGSNTYSLTRWRQIVHSIEQCSAKKVFILATEEEMKQPYLSPLLEAVVPCAPSKQKAGLWTQWPMRENTEPPVTYLEDQSTMGQQLAKKRRMLALPHGDQASAWIALGQQQKQLLHGRTGSGKTEAMLRAACEQLKEHPKAKVCYIYANPLSKATLQARLEDIWHHLHDGEVVPFPTRRFYLMHIWEQLTTLIKGFGQEQKTKMGSYSDIKRFAKRCLDLVEEKEHDFPELYDVMMIDDAQHLGEEALQVLHQLIKPDETTKERSCSLSYDHLSNVNKIPEPDWSTLGRLQKPETLDLRENIHSTQAITEFSLNVLYNLVSPYEDQDIKRWFQKSLIKKTARDGETWWRYLPQLPKGPAPYLETFRSQKEQMEAIAEKICYWIEHERIPPSSIKVVGLLQWNKDHMIRFIRPILAELGVDFEVEEQPLHHTKSQTVIATSPRGMVGQQAECVVIVSVEQFAGRKRPFAEKLFTSMSAASSILALYGKLKDPPSTTHEDFYEVLEQSLTQLHAPDLPK